MLRVCSHVTKLITLAYILKEIMFQNPTYSLQLKNIDIIVFEYSIHILPRTWDRTGKRDHRNPALFENFLYSLSDMHIGEFYLEIDYILTVPLCSVMSPTKHLTVANIRVATFTPSRNMVSVHFCQLPDSCAVGVMADGTVWTV